jgi:hypothetical protein
MSRYNNNHNPVREIARLAGHYEHASRRSTINKVRELRSPQNGAGN